MPELATNLQNFTSRPAFRGAANDQWLNFLKSNILGPVNEVSGGILSILQARSRDLWRNNEIAHGIIETIVTNVVGAGLHIYPRMKDSSGKLLFKENMILRELFEEYSENVTFNGQNLLTFITQALRTAELDGEHFLLEVHDPDSKFMVKWATFEGNQLASDRDSKTLAGVVGDNTVDLGVETDKFGRIIAYHIYTDGDDMWFTGRSGDVGVERIDASRVTPLISMARNGVNRGLPRLVAAMLIIADSGEHRHATLAKAWLHASWCAMVSGKDRLGVDADFPGSPVSSSSQSQMQPDDAASKKAKKSGFQVMPTAAGTVLKTDDDVDVNLLDSKSPPANYAEFENAILRAISAAVGLSPIAVVRDPKGASYSANRDWRNQDKMLFDQIGLIFDAAVIKPIYNGFIRSVFDINFLMQKPATALNVKAVKVQHPRPREMDPLKEQKAYTEVMGQGTESPETVAAEQGRDIFEELQSRKEVNDFADSIGFDPRDLFGHSQPLIRNADETGEEYEDNDDEDNRNKRNQEDDDDA